MIRKITPSGDVSTLAGKPGVHGHADGTGSGATFAEPKGLAVDGAGNLYVSDSSSGTIRKVTPAGNVTTIAGTAGTNGSLDATGPTAKFLTSLQGLALDPARQVLYVADTYNNEIRRLDLVSLKVDTVAGNHGSYAWKDGTGTAAHFKNPYGLALDANAILYVADNESATIRKVDTGNWAVTTIAGVDDAYESVDGPVATAHFGGPSGILPEPDGGIIVTDYNKAAIRRVGPDGQVTTIAGAPDRSGYADGTADKARFAFPEAIIPRTVPAGGFWILDGNNEAIRSWDPATQTVSTVAGSYSSSYADGKGSLAHLGPLYGPNVAVDGSGNLYFASGYWHTIRKMTPDGTVSTIAGTPGTTTPMGFTGNGMGASATFFEPNGVALDSKGNLFVADGYNCTIRMITPAGWVNTIAGQPQTPGNADGRGSAAQFSYPPGIIVGPGDIVYVADSGNSTIRKITPDGTVSTLAGTPGSTGFADGMGPAARFNGPSGLAMDASQNLYVTDYGNSAIRRITPAGAVTTLIGTPNLSGNLLPSGLPGALSIPLSLCVGAMTPVTQLWILTTGGIVYAQAPAP